MAGAQSTVGRRWVAVLAVLAVLAPLTAAPPVRAQAPGPGDGQSDGVGPDGSVPSRGGSVVDDLALGELSRRPAGPVDRALAVAAAPAPPRVPGRLPGVLAEGGSRLAGPGRADTAAVVSAAVFAPGAPVAYVATGGTFPDALSGGPAAALGGGPLLLAGADLPDVTRRELERLRPQRIVVLGGTVAIPETVEAALRELAPTVERVAGGDRVATAAAVSARAFPDGAPAAYVATGANFPDALAGGPAATLDGSPLLLVGNEVPEATRTELERLAPERIVVLGGPDVVPAAVEQALGGLAPAVERVAGPDRFTTAAAVAERFDPAATGAAFLATAGDFPDALAGGAAAASYGAPLLLAAGPELPESTAAQLARLEPSSVVALGGETALPDAALTAAAAASAVEALPDQVVTAAEAGDLPALRDAVGDDPVVAYRAVRELLAHTPSYAGLAKGPTVTVAEGAGNAWDLAAVLVDLLQGGGTTARYATGRVTLPAEDATRWLGVGDAETAAEALRPTGGDVGVALDQGDPVPGEDLPLPEADPDDDEPAPEIVSVSVDHVWVEAQLDGEWVPLDAAFRRHQLFGGRNLVADAGLDPAAATDELLAARGDPAIVPPETDEALAAARVGPVDMDRVDALADTRRTAALEWLEAYEPDLSLTEVLGDARPIRSSVVPGAESLPADGAAGVERVDEVPDAARLFLRLQLGDIDEVLPLTEVTGRRLSVDFVPADDEEAAEVEEAGGTLLGMERGSVGLRARILLDGEVLVEAADDDRVSLASTEAFDVGYSLGRPPEGDEDFPEEDEEGPRDLGTSDYRVVGGGNYDLATATGVIPQQRVAASRDRLEAALADDGSMLTDERMGQQLHALGQVYFAGNSLSNEYLAGTSNALLAQGVAGALVGHDLVFDADELSDAPVAAGGFFIDVKRFGTGFYDRTGAPDFDPAPLRLTAGVVSSTLEHDLFQRGLGLPALSTMELLTEAAENERLLDITSDNAGALLSVPMSPFIKLGLTFHLAAGGGLVIPDGDQQLGGWDGTGWIAYSPEDGTASYSIAGGLLEGGASILDLLGLSPEQQEALLRSGAGYFIAFLDGFLLGDVNRAGYDDPFLELARLSGQILSGLLVFGDVRDILVSASRGDDVGLALALAGLIPGGELLRSVRYIDDVAETAVRRCSIVSSVEVPPPTRSVACGPNGLDLLRGAIGDDAGQALIRIGRRNGGQPVTLGTRSIGGVDDAVSARFRQGGLDVEDIYVPRSRTDEYLRGLGVDPADYAELSRTGALGDAVADGLARDRGWTRIDVDRGPNAPGLDRVYQKPDGTFVLVENKATIGTRATNAGRLRSTVDGRGQYELSDPWLTGRGPNVARPDNNALARSVASGKITQAQADELRAAILRGNYEREVIIVRTPPNGNSVTGSVGARTQLDGSDGGPPARVTVVELARPGSGTSALQAPGPDELPAPPAISPVARAGAATRAPRRPRGRPDARRAVSPGRRRQRPLPA